MYKVEKSNIKNMDTNYLIEIGFKKNQINLIYNLVNKVIEKQIYSKIHYPYHNIAHIERVLCYCIWILNKKNDKGEILKNTDILLYAGLYHDCGRSLIISNKKHGVVGAKIAKEKLKEDLDEQRLNAIELLIETHAKPNDIVDFKNYKFTKRDKENIQILSNILKDADALDRNRIKVFKFAQCNPNYLRTNATKEIYHISNIFLKKYEEAKSKTRGIK